jgi:hypothetical protein
VLLTLGLLGEALAVLSAAQYAELAALFVHACDEFHLTERLTAAATAPDHDSARPTSPSSADSAPLSPAELRGVVLLRYGVYLERNGQQALAQRYAEPERAAVADALPLL